MLGEPDLSVPARAIGDPARSRMLLALLDGSQRPAGELARAAAVAPSTASEHLGVLVAAGLVRVTARGRHRYYALAGPDVGRALEALLALAPVTAVTSLRGSRVAADLVAGRTCYDHLAGDLGLRVSDLLVRAGVVPVLVAGVAVSRPGSGSLAGLGLGEVPVGGRRPFARGCLDWTGRRPHVGGRLGCHVLQRFRASGWLEERAGSRAVRLSSEGVKALASMEKTR